MSVTRAQIRAICGVLTGQGHSIAMTGGSTSTAVSATFEDYALGADDVLNRDFWLAMTTLAGSANSFEERRISDYATSGTTATVSRVYSGAVANGDIGELWRMRPSNINNGITRALRWLYQRGIHLPIEDESIVIDNRLSNGSFETEGGTTFTSWTETGAGLTVTAETSRVVHGTNAAKLVTSGSTGQLGQDIFTGVNIRRMVGRTLRFEGWGWASDSDSLYLRVTFDGSTYTTKAHSGLSEWEGPDTFFVDATIPEGATQITCEVYQVDGVTTYVDSLVAYIDPIPEYPMPTRIVRGPRQVLMQRYRSLPPTQSTWDLVSYQNPPRAGHRIRIKARGRATEPTAETSAIEVSGELADLLAMKALSFAYTAEASYPRSAVRDEAEHQAAYWDQEAERMLASGVNVEVPPLIVQEGVITDGDGEDRTLVFRMRR